jgi:hypothetical protein
MSRDELPTHSGALTEPATLSHSPQRPRLPVTVGGDNMRCAHPLAKLLRSTIVHSALNDITVGTWLCWSQVPDDRSK